MGAEQSADTTLPGKLQSAARRAFSKEHGRDPTEEEEARFTTAFDRNDPTDAHLGTVTAEEADACREIARLFFKSVENREPTDDELSKRTDTLARCMRRAAIEALEPDVEAVRRELVRRAVEAEKASGDAAAPSRVAFGPPPRPADEGERPDPRRSSSARRAPSTRRSGSSRPRPMLCGRRRTAIARQSKAA